MPLGDLATKIKEDCITPVLGVKTKLPLRQEKVELNESQAIDIEKRIAVAPAIQEPDQQEKELDELISKLNDARRHTIEDARKKGVPMKALLHAAALWLSDDRNDWTAASDTIYSFTSPFGLKQLQCPPRGEVFIPDIGKGRATT